MSRNPPLASARTVNEANRPRAWIGSLEFAVKELARQRAPTKSSEFRHRAGVAAEMAVSGYEDEPINREIYADFEGDDGYDIEVSRMGSSYKVEVKCVTQGRVELKIEEDSIDTADYFYLCRSPDPTTMVELLGYIDSNGVREWGETSPNDGLVRVQPKYLFPLEPVRISPEDIRESQVSDLDV